MMLCNSLSFPTLPRLIPTTHHPPPPILQVGRRRGISVVTRAGPSTTTYIFAFVFPLTLLAVTFFTSIRIADKLDQKFLEEFDRFTV
ncbi:high chlorophyll fluorescence 153 [Perilla frutescens var. frutescens]|nr:high chlorophyll fluorescence 153 [Perilla frutescens var. frutescens]